MLTDFDARTLALDPQRSFIVQAPAGSGKTGLLVYRMLSLLGTVRQPQEVLAITFTRKATAEMRERLLHLLRLSESGARGANEFEQLGIDLATVVMKRNRKLVWNLLDSPHQLQIQTIDAFCGHLAGSMPWLSRLGDRPRTTDKPEAHYAAAIEQLLSELLESDSELADALQSVLLQLDFNYNKARALFTSMLRNRDQWLRHIVRTDLPALRGALELAWQTVANEQIADLSQLIPTATIERLLALARYASQNGPEDRPETAVKLASALEPLVNFDRSVRLLGVPQWQALSRMLLTGKGEALRKTVNKNDGFPAQQKETAEMKSILEQLKDDDELLMALNGAWYLPALQFSELDWAQLTALERVLKALAGFLQLRFRSAGECDHSEVTQRANLALRELNDPTDLGLRMDHQLHHILVDEFQDTSHGQIELLKRLTAGWTQGQQAAESRTLFLVGDPMQSVYRFREADVSLFLQVADNAHTSVFDNVNIEPLVLSENFRSSRTLVDWFNNTFSESFPAHDNVLNGAIRYANATSNNTATDPGISCQLATDAVQEAALVVSALQQAIDDLPDEQARVGLLVRGRNHLQKLLPAMQAAGIAYAGVDIQPLKNQQAVIDVLALCKAISREDDRVSWLSLLRGPWCGCTLTEIKQLAGRVDLSVWQQLGAADLTALPSDSEQRLRRFVNLMREVLAQRQQVELSTLSRWAWQQLGGPDTLFGAAVEDVETVFDLIRDLQRGGDLPSMNDLDNALEGLFAKPPPGEQRAPKVIVSTMHKAKGLQYHTVVLPCLAKTARAQSKDIMMWAEYQNAKGQPQLLLAPFQMQDVNHSHYNYLRELDKKRAANEAMRLIYVACTRAEQKLVLIGEAKIDEKNGELKPPARNTLLATIWDAIEPQFELWQTETPLDVEEVSENQTLARLPSGYIAELPPSVRWQSTQQLTTQPSEDEQQELLAWDWSGEVATTVGTVLHRWLQFNHQRLFNIELDDSLTALWRAELLNAGLPPERLSAAMQRLRQAFKSMQSDPHARFVFADYAEQRNEYTLSANEEGSVNSYRIDRTFVADEVRWVIDYKTTYTQSDDIDAFVDQQLAERHRPQLEKYGALMQHLDNRPIKLAVYFPLLARLRSWDL